MIQFSQVNITFGGETLFNDVSFMINSGEKVGLVGKNGAGKSTMLKLLNNELEPAEGNVIKKQGIKIGYLPQELKVYSEKSVWEEAKAGLEELNQLQRELTQVTKALTTREDYESEGYQNLIEKSTHINDRLTQLGVGAIDGKIELILQGLGFDREDFEKLYKDLSGGWKMRVELTKLLLKSPDVLLLDEPTNHLDIQSIDWLEKYLKKYQGAVIIISHDKRFLDQLTNRTIEIANKKIYDYKFNYTNFLKAREERILLLAKQQANQEKEIQETEKFVERFRYKASKAKQVQSRVKQLEKIERIEVDTIDETRLNIKFPEAPHSGKVVLETKDVQKSFGTHQVLKGIDFEIERGEKIALVGKNGQGKSTFLKMILGEYKGSGEIVFGHKVETAYYAQNQADLLNFEDTVFDTIDKVAEGEVRKNIRSLLGSFLFGSEEIEKKVKVLSGGEKARLALCKMMLSPTNFLILDEPTNHLDISTKELLKKSIENYQGAVLIVSHDRSFLSGLTNKVLEFKNGYTHLYHGDIDYYLEKTNNGLDELEDKNSKRVVDNSVSSNENRYELKKKLDSRYRKLKNRIGSVEREIEQLEQKQGAIEQKVYEDSSNTTLFNQLGEIQDKLKGLLEEWEQLQEEFEQVGKERDAI